MTGPGPACGAHHPPVSLLEADARRQGVRIVCDVQQQPVPLQGDRVLLGQALLNLMKNGIKAMRDTPREQRKLLVSFSVSDQRGEIRIRDAGTGVSGEAAAHLFEPFFTTKTEGLGVGLNICRSVIEAHHGRLWHEANPEGGSTFCITLPLNHGTASP